VSATHTIGERSIGLRVLQAAGFRPARALCGMLTVFVFPFGARLAPEGASASLRNLADRRRPPIEAAIQSAPTTPAAVQQALQACLDVGMDEVIALPEIAELEQVDRLVEVVNKITGLEAVSAYSCRACADFGVRNSTLEPELQEVIVRTRTPLSPIERAYWQYCLQLVWWWAFC
jgi:hypothetical protein